MAKPKSRPSPERNLAPEQFSDLNKQFYSAHMKPHNYLEHRFRSILLAAQPPDKMASGFDAELSLNDLQVSYSAEDWDSAEVEGYVSTESTVLLHHAVEALFRLYFAHVDNKECPWLGVGRLRLPSQFKERLTKFVRDSASVDVVGSAMDVFHGHQKPNDGNRELWDDLQGGLMRLLVHLASRLQKEAPLYNSAKHGLALIPGAAVMTVGDPEEEEPFLRADGPSITYLTVKDGQRGKRWAQETHWLDASKTLAITALALHQMSNLWNVARHRYIGETFDQSKMHFMSDSLVKEVLARGSSTATGPFTVPSMSMELLYYEDGPQS